MAWRGVDAASQSERGLMDITAAARRPGTVGTPGIRGASSTTPATGNGASGDGTQARVDTVSISGRGMLSDRLFHGRPVSYTPGYSAPSGTIFGFLTDADRDTVASLYEYAQTHGIDPAKVDNIAFDLGIHRSAHASDEGPATMYDADGVLVPIAFSPDDETVAQRILTSKALKDSALPEEFLRYELTPATGIDKAADFHFLEQVVYATSPTGSDGATDPTAVLAPRSVDYFRSLQASRGELLSPEQARHLAAGMPDRPPSFVDYAARVRTVAPLLADTDKSTLAGLYAAVTARYGPTSPHLQSIDRLARSMAVTHLTDTTRTGSPRRTPPATSAAPQTSCGRLRPERVEQAGQGRVSLPRGTRLNQSIESAQWKRATHSSHATFGAEHVQSANSHDH